MALTPKERADFDEIVTRLRREDGQLGVIKPRRGPALLLLGMVVAVLVLGIGVALLGQGVVGPILMLVAVVGGSMVVRRAWVESRRRA